MATLVSGTFSYYELTEQETLASRVLSPLQKMNIQNIIAATADEKINLVFDPTNPNRFMQQEADLAGKIAILKYVIELSDMTEEELRGRIQSQQDSQNQE